MARITFTHRSIRTAVGTATLGIAAAMALGACGSPTQGVLSPVATTSPNSAAGPIATDAAKTEAPTAEKVDKVQKVAAVQKPAAKKSSARSADDAPPTAQKYKKIVEPFSKPGHCDEGGTTIEMTACVLKEVVDVDYTVDVLQAQRYLYSISAADQQASRRDDANWLAKRTKPARPTPPAAASTRSPRPSACSRRARPASPP